MLDFEEIKSLTTKYQTTEQNIIREYLQNLFLNYFYKQKNSETFLFKGGTSLKVVFESPRFSEDLDFTGIENGTKYEKILLAVLDNLSKEGISFELTESKSTSGGWLAIINFNIYNYQISIKNEISFRDRDYGKEDKMVSNDFIPAYRIILLSPKLLIKEKIQAAVSRKKSRDYFDLYFILRDTQLRKELTLNKSTRSKLIAQLEKTESYKVENELKYLLPISFHPVLKNLPERLIKELS